MFFLVVLFSRVLLFLLFVVVDIIFLCLWLFLGDVQVFQVVVCSLSC